MNTLDLIQYGDFTLDEIVNRTKGNNLLEDKTTLKQLMRWFLRLSSYETFRMVSNDEIAYAMHGKLSALYDIESNTLGFYTKDELVMQFRLSSFSGTIYPAFKKYYEDELSALWRRTPLLDETSYLADAKSTFWETNDDVVYLAYSNMKVPHVLGEETTFSYTSNFLLVASNSTAKATKHVVPNYNNQIEKAITKFLNTVAPLLEVSRKAIVDEVNKQTATTLKAEADNVLKHLMSMDDIPLAIRLIHELSHDTYFIDYIKGHRLRGTARKRIVDVVRRSRLVPPALEYFEGVEKHTMTADMATKDIT